jgi:hypothetical protein
MSVRPFPVRRILPAVRKVGDFWRAGGPNSPTFGRTATESSIGRPQPARLLGEPIHATDLAGGVLVIGGVFFGGVFFGARRRVPAELSDPLVRVAA